MQDIADAGLGRAPTLAAMGARAAQELPPREGARRATSFGELMRQFLSQIGAKGERVGASEGDADEFEWRFLFVAGMWFQDLFNYDFRRTEMCIIPYGTQMGEISFCAYNTGVGWRQIIEKMKRPRPSPSGSRTHGRHPVYAKNQTCRCRRDARTSSCATQARPARRRLPRSSRRADAFLAGLVVSGPMTPVEKTIVKSLVAVAWADGALAEPESGMIDSLLWAFGASERRGSRDSRVREEEAHGEGRRHRQGARPAGREILLAHAALLTHADGKQTPAEAKLLKNLAEHLEFSDDDTKRIIDGARERAKKLSERV